MPTIDLNNISYQMEQFNNSINMLESAKNYIINARDTIDNNDNLGTSEPAVNGLNEVYNQLEEEQNLIENLKNAINEEANSIYNEELEEEKKLEEERRKLEEEQEDD